MAEAPCHPSQSVLYYLQQQKEITQWYTLQRRRVQKGVAILKNNKAAGRDDVLVEQLTNLGPKSHRWLLTVPNKCVMENKIPTLWRQSMIIANLKPGMEFAIPKSYRPITVDMSKTFDTINIHTLIRKLLQTNIPGTLFQFIANYIKRRRAYTTYRNHTSSQRQFKTGIPKGGVLSPTLFNIYTADIPPPRAPVQVMAYADDITITSTHPSTSAA